MSNLSRLPSPRQENWEWQYAGACVGMDVAIFFSPDRERGPRRLARETRAKQICAGCPVIDECREHALSVLEPFGVWGGMTINEREQELVERHGTTAHRAASAQHSGAAVVPKRVDTRRRRPTAS